MSDSESFTLVVSEYAPPKIGGTSSVLYELVRHFPKGTAVLVTRQLSTDEATDDRVLHVPTIYVGESRALASRSWTRPIRLVRMTMAVVKHLKRSGRNPRNILAVFPSLDFLMMSMALSRLMNVPLYTYLNDCLEEVAITRYDRLLSRFVARVIFSKSVKVYAMSELMEHYYEERGLQSEALPHGIDAALTRSPTRLQGTTCIRIGFAGEVYQTNDRAIRDLAGVKRVLQDRVELHFAISRKSVEWLAELGVIDSIDSISIYSTYDELLSFLSTCDILFVPMNFESAYSEDLKTIFPTKVTDYWLAQRPILVYGPEEYAFVVEAAEDGYAISVTEEGVDGLTAAVIKIADSPDLREQLVSASMKMIEEHDSARVSRRLMADLGIV